MRAMALTGMLIAAVGWSHAANAQEPLPGPGEWMATEKKSPIDDSPNVELIALSTNTFSDRYGREKSGALRIACLDHSTIIVVWPGGQYLADLDGADAVTYRIDKAKAVTAKFSISSNNQFIGLWQGSGIPLIKSLASAQKFFIRVTPWNESSIDLEFDVSKLATYLPKVRAACNW